MRKERKEMEYVIFNVEKLNEESRQKLIEELESHRMECRKSEKEGIMKVYIPRKIAEKLTLEVFARIVVKSSNAACSVEYRNRKVYVEVTPKNTVENDKKEREDTKDIKKERKDVEENK